MPIGYVEVLANGTPMTSSPGAAQTPRIRPVQPLARPSNSASASDGDESQQRRDDQRQQRSVTSDPRPVPLRALVDGVGGG